MSKSQTLKVLIHERLAAAAEEIFALFERTIAEYEKELVDDQKSPLHKLDGVLSPRIVLVSGSVRTSSLSPGTSQNQKITETADIKEEPEEQTVKQEDEQLSVSVPEFSSVVCAERAECTQFLQRQTEHTEEAPGQDISSKLHVNLEIKRDTEHSYDTDNDDYWEPPFRVSSALMQTATEAYEGCHREVQIRDGNTPPHNTVMVSEVETNASVNNGVLFGTDKRAEKKHLCYICKKRFKGKYGLQMHIRVHTDKPYGYSCFICKKSFSQKGSLAVHTRIHTGERPFKCLLCKKQFVKNSDLVCHTRTHTGEKPYSCSICKKTFAKKGNLDVHKFTHTGEKPYSCSVCKQAFSRKNTLEVHKRTHTGEKPFSCFHCKKTFGRKCILEKHVRLHTGEKPYSCPICEKSYVSRSSLDKHTRKKHK